MADGVTHVKYHDKMWVVGFVFALILGAGIFYKSLANFLIFVVLYIFFYAIAERFISPDLDLLSLSAQDGRMIMLGKHTLEKIRHWNFFIRVLLIPFCFVLGLFGLFTAQYSMAYAWLIEFGGGHRSVFSHSPVLSTLIRQLWFNVPISFVINWIFTIGNQRFAWHSIYWELYLDYWLVPYLLAQFVAWSVSDITHLVLDSDWAKNRLYTPETHTKK
jgi:hypothetical protein